MRIPLLPLALAASCTTIHADDAGDTVWVHDAIAIVQGRHPKGYEEVHGLAHLATDVSRQAALDALFEDDSYVDYWTEVILDAVQVERAGRYRADARCYEDDLVSEAYDTALIDHILYDDPRAGADGWCLSSGNSGACPAFTLLDVLQAALRTDRLAAVFDAQLVPMTVFGDQGTGREVNLREHFGTAYLNRQQDCLECHTTTWSVTDDHGGASDWDQHHPAAAWAASGGLPSRVDLEGTALSTTDGTTLDYGGRGERWEDLLVFFRATQFGAVDGDGAPTGTAPWGLADSCVTLDGDFAQYGGFVAGGVGVTEGGIGGMVRADTYDVLDLVGLMQDSQAALETSNVSALSQTAPPNLSDWSGGDATDGGNTLSACVWCHSAYPESPDLYEVIGAINPQTLYDILAAGIGPMSAQTDPEGKTRDLVAYVAANPSLFAQPGYAFYDEPAHAVNLLVAGTFVDRVADEIGHGLAIEHGHPRTVPQGMELAHLTDVFVDSDWSLRAVLSEIALSNLAGRQAPSVSTEPPYPLDPVANPWALVESPSDPADDANGVGDLVHERSVPMRAHLVHEALLWPDSRAFGGQSGESWPDANAFEDMGRYTHARSMGREAMAFDLLLTWDAYVGMCAKPETVLAGDVTLASGVTAADDDLLAEAEWVDFVDLLQRQAAAASLTPMTPTPTLREMFGALRNRVLGSERMTSAERAAVDSMVDPATLDKTVSLFPTTGRPSPHGYEDELRIYCGALLTSPQVVLGGLHADLAHSRLTTPWIPCIGDEPCTTGDWCDHWADAAEDAGHDTTGVCADAH